MPKAKFKSGVKRMKTRMSRADAPNTSQNADHLREEFTGEDHMSQLSLELLEKIFRYLPIRTVFSCEILNHHFQLAVHSYLKVIKEIDLTEHVWHGYVPKGFTLSSFTKILKRCPKLEVIRGLHVYPESAGLIPCLNRSDQMTHGIIKELKKCTHLRQVEVSTLDLADALIDEMPEIDLGHFSNRGGCFEADCRPYFTLVPDYHVRKLHLTGVTLPELPETPHVQEVILEWVELTSSQPFQNFVCPALRTFVMRNCFGPLNALKYVALIDNLARCLNLERLELVRVPFLGGLIQHKVEESAQENTQAFRKLKTILISGCKNCTEQDVGHLILAAMNTLESLTIQPCLTRDSLFLSLKAIEEKLHTVKDLHLGYVDPWTNSGKYTPTDLVGKGLAEVNENPALLTDAGMKAMGQVFPNLSRLTIYNCPHLRYPRSWLDVEPVDTNWSQLRSLYLRHCHGIQLNGAQCLSNFIEWLPSLVDIYLDHMFPKPPKGCSRVGLSAGTGIGVSSALVAMQNPGAQHAPQPQVQAEVQVHDVAPRNQEPRRQPRGDDERGPHRQIQDAPPQRVGHQVPVQDSDRDSSSANQEDRPESGVPQNIDNPNDMKSPAGRDQSSSRAMRKSEQPSTSKDVAGTSHDMQESNSKSSHPSKDSSVSADTKEDEMFVDCDSSMIGVRTNIGDVTATSKDMQKSNSRSLPPTKPTSVGVDTDEDEFVDCDSSFADSSLTEPMIEGDTTNNVNSTPSRETRQEVVPSFKPSTSKKNVRDASTSAMSVAGSCPIHGTMMHEMSNDDEEDDLPTFRDGSSQTAEEDSACQGVSVSVKTEPQETQSSSSDLSPMMCDQATSTSDPVMESDPVLIFKCNSPSLESATFEDCGISHIDIGDCERLKYVQGHNLPILKYLHVSGTDCHLSNVQFEQCPKMQYSQLLDELISHHPSGDTDRFIRLRPMSRTAVEEIKRGLECRLDRIDHNVLVVIDHTSPPQTHHSSAITDWVHVFSCLNRKLLSERVLDEARHRENNLPSFTLDQIVCDDRLEVITDLPWIKPLIQNKSFQLGTPPTFGKSEEQRVTRLQEHLAESISMAMQEKKKIFPKLFCIYVQTSDQDGTAIPEEFTVGTY